MRSSASRLRCTIVIAQANWNDGGKVAIRRGVDAVDDDSREAQVARERLHVDLVARPGDGARPERERIGFVSRARHPLVIAPQRGHVREEEVRHQDGLRGAEVRERGHERVAGRGRLVHQSGDHAGDPALQQRNVTHQVEPQIERHLLVARPARMQPPAGIANPFDEHALHEAVNVLVVAVDEGRIRTAALANLLERLFDLIGLGVRQHAGASEGARPGDAAGYILVKEAAVEAKRRAELEGVGIRRPVESSRPECCHRIATAEWTSASSSSGAPPADACSYSANGDRRPTMPQPPLNSFMRMTPVTRS